MPQLPFNLAPEPDYSFTSFEVGPCNSDAVTALRAYLDWPSPILALIGPAGSGKSHLATAWAESVQANLVTPHVVKPSWRGQPLVFDNADSAVESQLFAVMNMALNGDVPGLLITGAKLPKAWNVELPDLRSRLANVPIAALSDPDDATLEQILRKLFEDKGRAVSRDLVTYLLAYQDRAVTAMRGLIAELDVAASQNKSDLTKAFAARYLSKRSEGDLFAVPRED